MKENNQEVAEATEKITNPELVEKIEDKEEVIVMNDKTEVAKATVVAGGEKAPIIPEDMIGDFEEEIDEEEMEKLEKENKKILDPIGAEVKEKMKEIEEKELEQNKIKELEQAKEMKDNEIRMLKKKINEMDRQIVELKQTERKALISNDIQWNYRIVKNILLVMLGGRYFVSDIHDDYCYIRDSLHDQNIIMEGYISDIREFFEDIIGGSLRTLLE